MPLRVEKNLSDVFLLYRFPPTGGWGGGLQDASGLLFAPLGKKEIKSQPLTLLSQCWVQATFTAFEPFCPRLCVCVIS